MKCLVFTKLQQSSQDLHRKLSRSFHEVHSPGEPQPVCTADGPEGGLRW